MTKNFVQFRAGDRAELTKALQALRKAAGGDLKKGRGSSCCGNNKSRTDEGVH
jgi:hypothetical protein